VARAGRFGFKIVVLSVITVIDMEGDVAEHDPDILLGHVSVVVEVEPANHESISKNWTYIRKVNFIFSSILAR